MSSEKPSPHLHTLFCFSLCPTPEKTITCGSEDTGVTEAVASSKGLHHAVNFLGFSRQPEAPQELPRGTEPWSVRLVGFSVAPGMGWVGSDVKVSRVWEDVELC